MVGLTSTDPPGEEALRRLELAITRRLDGLLHGDHRGLVPAHGSEVGEARVYAEGDDVRRIDWNVTARMLDPHVRETIAERELETWLVVDLSASLEFGTASCTKRDLAVAASAAVGFLTARGGNRVGALIVRGASIEAWPARGGRGHLRALIRRLATAPAESGGGATDLEPAIRRLLSPAHRRGLAVVVSDFLGRDPRMPAPWQDTLRAAASRHDVLAVELIDPRELELPDVGLLALIDPETGARRHVQTSNRRIRESYATAARAQREAIARALRSSGVDHLVLRTDHDWLLELVRFVASRRDRVDRLRRPVR